MSANAAAPALPSPATSAGARPARVGVVGSGWQDHMAALAIDEAARSRSTVRTEQEPWSA